MITRERLSALLLAVLTISPVATALFPTAQAGVLSNAPPDPIFTVSPGQGTTATLFRLDASGSHVPPDTNVTIEWGDGAKTEALLEATHQYERAGDFVVRLHLQNAQRGDASAYALVRVRAMEPAAWADREADTLETLPLLPNHVVLPGQGFPTGLQGAGVVAVLVSGLDPTVLPIGIPNGPTFEYVTCDVEACAKVDLANATDPDGVSTGALTILLQKVLNATYYAIDVEGSDGRVTLPRLARGLELARSLDPVAVVSLLPSDAGFLDPAAAIDAYDPGLQLGKYGSPGSLYEPERLAFLRALAANRAQYDFGDNGTYPVPNGYNETRAPDHGHGYGGGHHEHTATYGGGAHGHAGNLLDTPSTGCIPLPVVGPREDRPDIRVPTYQRFEESIKLFQGLNGRDLQILSPVEAAALAALTAYYRDLTCLQHALSHLAHLGVPVVVAAGDGAYHGDVVDPVNATWDLQSLRGIAEFPQVITVGATTSTAAGYGAPWFGTRRVVLPTSAAGPTRSLHGVKPDFVAPGDIPSALVGQALASGAYWLPERSTLYDGFRHDRTGGLVLGNATLQQEELRLHDSDLLTGVLYTGSRDLAPQPALNVSMRLAQPAGNWSRNAIRFAAQDGNLFEFANGFGFELVPQHDGRVNVTSMARVGGAEYAPPCVGVCPPSVRTVTLDLRDGFHLRAGATPSARPGHHLLTYEVFGADGILRATLARELPVNATGHLCACRHVAILSDVTRASAAHWTNAAVDNVTAIGLSGPAQASYDEDTPVEEYGPTGVRPSTRYAAAYAAGLAIVHVVPLLATEPDPIERLVRLRGALAGQAKPLADVPPYVQGAGELNLDAPSAAVTLLATEHQAPGVPGIDYGLRYDGNPSATLEFHWNEYIGAHQVLAETSGLTWWRLDRDLQLHRVQSDIALDSESVTVDDDTRKLWVNVTSLPTLEGVYATLLPISITTALGVGNPLYVRTQVPVLLTKGVDATLDLADLDAPVGATAWLLPPMQGRHLVYDPLPGGPAANGTLDASRRVSFGHIAPAGYSLALAVTASLPVPDEASPNGTHEAGRPRDFVVVSRALRPGDGVGVVTTLDPAARLPVPVAYRFLDYVESAAFSWRQSDPRFTNAQILRGTANLTRGRWGQRGDARAAGHALDEPLPVGETVVGWDLRHVGRAPGLGIGNQSALDAKQDYLAALDAATYQPTSLTGHLDPRPYGLDGNTVLPALVLETSVAVPRPLDSLHGTLLLPVDFDEATVLVRLTAGSQSLGVLLTDEGAWVPGPAKGALWPGFHDRFDNVTDFTEGGVLSGFGHLHAIGSPGDLRLVPRTESGHLVPFGFHDLPDSLASVTLQVLVRPDPTSLAGRAWSTGPLDPVPGPRFRLDGAALHAWTTGLLERDNVGTATLNLGDLRRFDLPVDAEHPDPLHSPVVRLAPPDASGEAVGESIEVYLRSERDRIRLSGVANVVSGDDGVTRASISTPASARLSFTYGRGVNTVLDPLAHPLGILRPYALVDLLDRVQHERFVDFASLGPSLWRVDGYALRAAAGDAGDITVQFRDGVSVLPETLTSLPARFPDMPDPSPPAGHAVGDCAYDGLGLVGVLVGNLAQLGCYRGLPGGYSAAGATADEREAAGVTQDAATGQQGQCIDAQASQPCLGDVLEQVDTASGTVWSRFASLRDTLLGGGSKTTSAARATLWEGVVPQKGALLVLDHVESGGTGVGSLNATLVSEGVEHRLVTLEGQEGFRAADPRLRATKVDVFDLAGYSGQRIRIDLVKENGALTWTIPAWRIVPIAQPAILDPHVSPALLDPASKLPRPSPVLRELDAPTESVRAGPAQASRAATAGVGLVHLTAGLDVAQDLTLQDRHLVIGRDADEGGLIRVHSGATLTLSRVTLAPRDLSLPWGILVETGGTLRVDNATLLAGGHHGSGLAAIAIESGGRAFVNMTDVLAGDFGVKLQPGALLLSWRSTFADNVHAVFADSATVTLLDAFVDHNVQGVVAKNATVEVFGGLYTSNREGALQLQDTLAAVSGATFAWNGEAGPRAAVAAYEGLDTGRVVLHDVRFHADARALHARAPVDAHDLTVKQAETALLVGPDATLRLDHANVTSTSGSALYLDAGSRLYADASTLKGAPWADCGPVPPALIVTNRTTRDGHDDAQCPIGTHAAGTNTDGAEWAWRAVVVRPWLHAGANPVLLLPGGSDATLVDVNDGDKRDNLTLENGTLTVQGGDRALVVKGARATGAPVSHAWGYLVQKDTTAPTGGLRLLAGGYLGEDGRLYVRPFSAALALDVTDGTGSGPGAHGLLLSSEDPDGRAGVTSAPVHDAIRGTRAVLGKGAPAALAPVTGDHVTLAPLLRDRAGNAQTGDVVSVTYDRTPPRTWLHAANPCGDLFGYDLGWHAHDPQVGSGLRPGGVPPNPAQNWTYVLSVATINLTDTDVSLDTILQILDLGTVDRLRQADPQALNAQALKEIERRLSDPLNGLWLTDLPLLDWVEIQRFTRDEEGIHLSAVRDLNDFLLRNLNWTLERAQDVLDAKNDTEDWIQALRDQRLEDINVHDRVNQTLEEIISHLEEELANLLKLTPIILAIRIEARDALGNSALWYEPVLSDVFSPTHLFYFLGDTIRERVMPLIMAPRATLDLADLEGELTIFDPDCGLRDVTILELLPQNVTTPIATIYPREGRVTFDVFGVQDLFPQNLCGAKQLRFESTDLFGRKGTVDTSTILDRVAPLTELLDWQKVATSPLLPVDPSVPPPPADPLWISEPGFEVLAKATSLNLPACPLISASIHDMVVEATVDNHTHVRLAREHFGAARNGTLANMNVTFNATAPIEAKDFGMTDAEISGEWITVRVLSSDEAGNEETNASAVFGFRIDTMPPLCRIDHVEAKGGHTLPVAWTAEDVNQTVPGEVVDVSLLVRPSEDHPAYETDMKWLLYAPLPQPIGTANAALSTSPLPAWATAPILHDLDIACAAYDKAGNLEVGDAARTLLDLELPIVNWTTLAPVWANANVVLDWTVDEVVSGVDYVLLYAGETAEELAVRVNYTADFNNSWTLDPVLLTGEGPLSVHNGENWSVRVEAVDKVGNRYSRLHSVLFDTTPPTGNLDNIVAALVGGFLPKEVYDFVPNLQQATDLDQSPYAAILDVVGPEGSWVETLGADGKFHLNFTVGGGHSIRLTPCDAAGNCNQPTAWVSFDVDIVEPVTSLLQLANGVAPVSVLPGGASVSVVSTDTTTATFTVTDASGGSGIASLQVRARPLNAYTLQPTTEAATDLTVTDLGVLPGGARKFSASVGVLAPDRLYRFDVSATDAAGNREGGASGWAVLPGYFAYDATAPTGILLPLAPYFNLAAGAPVVRATLQDDVNGIGVGVASYRVTHQREGQSAVTTAPISASGAPWSNVSWTDPVFNPTTEEGLLLTYCVQPVDRFGRTGTCAGAASTFLDKTTPTASLVLPADVSLTDPYTKILPAFVGVKVKNDAPAGRRAAPVGEILLEFSTTEPGRSPSMRFDLAANGIVLAPNEEHTKTFDIAASDGQVYNLAGYAEDKAANRQAPGNRTYHATPRVTTEWGLYTFDSGDGFNDQSGNGRNMNGANGAAQSSTVIGIGWTGRFDGDAHLWRAGATGTGDKIAAMAWVDPTAADQTAGLIGRSELARDWGLWLEGGYPKATVETPTGFSTLTGTTKVPLNQWTHLALVYDGEFLRLYVNGVSAAPQSPRAGAVLESTGANVMIGAASQSGTIKGLVGYMDDVRIHRGLLTERDVNDLKDFPAWNGVGLTKIHVDVTQPLSVPAPHDLLQALPTVNANAYDVGPGTPSGVKTVRLQERVLDSNAYVASPVAKEGHLEIAQVPNREIPANTEFRWTHPLHLPAATTVNVRLAVNDSIPVPGDAPLCSPAETNVGTKASWRVLVNGVEMGRRQVGQTAFGDTVYHLTTTTTAPVGPSELVLAVFTGSTPWKACYPRLSVRFDDVTVRSGASALFADGLLEQGAWVASAPHESMTASFVQPAPAWSNAPSANAVYAESWDTTHPRGWDLQTGADTLARVDVVAGASDGLALSLVFEGATGSPSSVYDRAGRGIGSVDATHVFVNEKTTRVTATTTSRPGLQVELENKKNVVFVFESTLAAPLPPFVDPLSGNQYFFVDAAAYDAPGAPARVSGAWNAHTLDLAKAKADLGLTGKVLGLYAYQEKNVAALPGQAFGATVSLDDVRVLNGARARIDLPFRFPFYGKTYTTLYADVDGAVGVTAGFDAARTSGNFDGQRLLAPAWGDWTYAGVDESSGYRPHGVYVDNTIHNQTTILWLVGAADNPGRTQAFTLTVMENGEILTTYRDVPDRATLHRIGISAGDGRKLDRTAALASLANVEDGYLPGDGVWRTKDEAAYGTGLAVTPDKPLHLRTIAVDKADNEQVLGGVRARVTRDAQAPFVAIQPILDYLGGMPNRDLRVLTTLVDNHTTIDANTIVMKVWDLAGASNPDVPDPTQGENVSTATPFDVVHRALYALNLTAKDRFGQLGWSNHSFTAVIKPEPDLDLLRALDGAVYVDDVLQGALAGATGALTGDRFSAGGKATVETGSLWLNVTLDGTVVASGSGAEASFTTAFDAAGLASGTHTFKVRAEHPNGSFAEEKLVFQHQNGTQLAFSDVENDTANWWRPVFPSGDRADALPEAARRGALGIRVHSVNDAATTAFARYNLTTPAAAARHWAFVRVTNLSAGSGFEVLKLPTATGTAFSARVDANMVLWALSDGVWVNTTRSLHPGHWEKIEAKDDGSTVALYLNHTFVGTYGRSASGAVTAFVFAAAAPGVAGDLDVDDVGADRADVVKRVLLQDDLRFHSTTWLPSNTSAFTTDSFGRRGMKVDSYADRNMTASLSVPAVPDYVVSVDVGLLGRGCAGTGHLLRILDAQGGSVLRLECSGTLLRASHGAGLATAPFQLVDDRYNRIVAHVGTGSYTLFVNDRLAGVFNLTSTLPASQVRVGGGEAELWYNDVSVARGRLLVSDGFDTMLSSAWRLPAQSATIETVRSADQAITGNHSVKVSSAGAVNQVGPLERPVALPPRAIVSARVYVPATAAFEDFHVLGVGNANGVEIGLVLGHDGIDPTLRLGIKRGATTTWVANPGVTPGWHYFALRLEQDSDRWTPSWNGGPLNLGDTFTGATLDRLVFGDRSVAAGQGTVYLDDVQVLSLNTPPVITLAAPLAGATVPRGSVEVVGTVHDVDPADAPDRIELLLDGKVVHVANAPVWRYTWDTSALAPGSSHTLQARAWQSDGRTLFVETAQRSVTIST